MEAVALHGSRAAEKLRTLELAANALQVFITTGRYTKGKTYSNAFTVTLSRATNYTPEIVSAARTCLERIYREGYSYKKAGVMLLGLVLQHPAQGNLFWPPNPQQAALMKAVDEVNKKMGRDTIFLAATGIEKPWQMRKTMMSPRYTTCRSELPVVFARPPAESYSSSGSSFST